MIRRRLPLLIIFSLLLAYLAVLGVRPLVMPDEFRYAEIPREMIANNNWIVPHLNGMVYFEKPPLGYWVSALSMVVFGETTFAARLPFALATLLTGAIAYLLTKQSAPDRASAPYVAGVFLTSLLVAGIGTFAVLDALLMLLLTAMLAAFFVATECAPGRRRQAWLLAAGAAAGAAFLTKGFLVLAVGGVVAAPYMIWTRRWREMFTLPWLPLIAAALVAAPWCIAIARSDSDFWRYFFWVEHWNRLAGGTAAQHARPWWFFAPIILAGGLPWTSLLPAALANERCAPRSNLIRFAACWTIGPFIFFSLASGKLPTYILPCFVPMSIYIGSWIGARGNSQSIAKNLRRLSIGFIAVTWVLSVIVLIQTMTNFLNLDNIYTENETHKGYIGSLSLFLAGAATTVLIFRRHRETQTAGLVMGVLVLFATGPFMFPAHHGHKTPGAWIDQQSALIDDDSIIISDSKLVHAVCWRLQRDDVLMLESLGELRYGAERQPERLLTNADLSELVRDPLRTRSVVTMVQTKRLSPEIHALADSTTEWRGMTFARFDPASDRQPQSESALENNKPK